MILWIKTYIQIHFQTLHDRVVSIVSGTVGLLSPLILTPEWGAIFKAIVGVGAGLTVAFFSPLVSDLGKSFKAWVRNKISRKKKQ